MVGQDGGALFLGEVSGGGTDGSEGGVGGRKDGYVFEVVDGFDEGGCIEGADEGGEVCGQGGVGGGLGEGEDGVDDVDDAAGEVEVLLKKEYKPIELLRCLGGVLKLQECGGYTYSSSNSALLQETAVDVDGTAIGLRANNLTTGYV